MKNVNIAIGFNEKIESVDYIEFSLVNGKTITPDDLMQWTETIYQKNKTLEARVLSVPELNLGDIPFENAIARINGISSIQTFTEKDGERNNIFPTFVMFECDGKRACIPEKILKRG